MTPRRTPYAPAELARLIAPASVAVVGVSERPAAFGSRVVANLGAFDGRVHQVNARHQVLHGRPCHPSLDALPEAPDCVVVATAREPVEQVVRDCARLGVGAAIILAAGFAETAMPDRVAAQARLTAIAREAGLRLVGPNTIGLVNYATGAGLTFSAMPNRRPLAPHAIGIVSQSGSLGFALAQAVERGVSVSHVLTAGNSCDVDVADHVAYLAADPQCRAVACVFEGMADPLRMVAAAELCRYAGKPLVLYKMATGTEGAHAALSHTGSLAGSEAAYRAAFAAAGVIQVDKLEALVETAAFFAKAPAPAAPGVAVIATSGGATIMAADKAELHGVPLPQPGAAAAAVLADRVPEYGSARNPCDVTAQVMSDPAALLACLDALLADPAYGALVTSHQYAYAAATARLPAFSRAAARHSKITAIVWVPEWLGGPGAAEIEADPHLALFHSADRCFATIAAWHAHAQPLPAPAPRLSAPDTWSRAAPLLDTPHLALTEREARRAMALYGLPVIVETLVQTADEAVAAAEAIGFPVVLKGESPAILHKTEAGLVHLALGDADAVRRAAAAILAAIGSAPFNGLLVQPMVRPGVELVLGARHDPQFGPLVVVGLGGVLIELLGDTAMALAPVSPGQAEAIFRSLKGAALLHGFRGGPAVDLPALAETVARFSELAADAGPAIAEMEINPLICTGTTQLAVDALIVKAAPCAPG